MNDFKIVEKLVLVNKDGKPVKKGDKLVDFRGDEDTVVGWREPQKPSSTGRIFVQEEGVSFMREYFPSVYGCKFVEDKS